MTTLQEVRDFIQNREYYNARVAIEYLDDEDEIEGTLLKIDLFLLQGRSGPAMDTARSLLRPKGEKLTCSQRLRSLLAAIRVARSEDPDAVAGHLAEARALVETLSPEQRAADEAAIESLAEIAD